MRLAKNKKFLLLVIGLAILIWSPVVILLIIDAPDNIPPVVNITSPAENATLSGTTTIEFTATDQQGVINEKQILIDGVIIQISSYSYSWDTTQEVDGLHTISCRAKDKTVWGDDEITVIVDNSEEPDTTSPSVTITAPTAGSTVSNTVTITMDATDANGISSYAIYIDGVFISDTKSYSWDTTQEINGSHTIHCEASDFSGNIGFDTISVSVNNSGETDTTPPNVTIISPMANATVSGIVTINMSATDANGISSYAIHINNILISNNQVYSWNTTQEIDGSYIVLCKAFDPSGNNG